MLQLVDGGAVLAVRARQPIGAVGAVDAIDAVGTLAERAALQRIVRGIFRIIRGV
jgi:hypothetical protein